MTPIIASIIKRRPTKVMACFNVYHLLRQCLSLDGQVVEMGTRKGITALLMQATLDEFGSDKHIHCYDSFDMGDAKRTNERDGPKVQNHNAARYSHSVEDVVDTFAEYGLSQPVFHAGWFEDGLDVPERVAFAYIDANNHSATKAAIEAVWPKLSEGGVMLFDDCCLVDEWPDDYPGVTKAVRESVEARPLWANPPQAYAVR